MIKKFTNIQNKKFLKKGFIAYYLRVFKLLYYEFIFFLERKTFRKHYSQSQQRKEDYNKYWSNFDDTSYFDNYSNKSYCWHILKNKYFLAPKGFTGDIFRKLIRSEIQRLKPKNVLEVGCGIGLNIFYLAKIFKNIKFYGVDISDYAINKNNLFVKKNKINNVKFYCMNAKNLSFKKNSFDLCYTVLALEQMNKIKIEVIRKIKNIVKKNIILVEPFADINKNLLNFIHTKNSDYFDLHYNELEKLGLTIQKKIDNFPQRLGLAAGFVTTIKVIDK